MIFARGWTPVTILNVIGGFHPQPPSRATGTIGIQKNKLYLDALSGPAVGSGTRFSGIYTPIVCVCVVPASVMPTIGNQRVLGAGYINDVPCLQGPEEPESAVFLADFFRATRGRGRMRSAIRYPLYGAYRARQQHAKRHCQHR